MGGFLRVLGRLPVNYRPIHAKLRKIEIKNFRGGRGGGNSLGGFLRVLGWSPEFFRIFLNFHIFELRGTNVKSCQFMSWRLSLHFSYCQLRCPLCGDFPLVSNIASSGVHMCCHRHYFFNKNLDSSSTPKNSDSGFCLFFRLKCTPELTI